MNNALKYLGPSLAAIILYLLFWPVPINPGSWEPPKAPDMNSGPYKINNRLKDLVRVSVAEFGNGPEDIALDTNGYVYTGLVNGKILRFSPGGSSPQVLAETGGRPLGMQFDASGNLIIADADKGLLSLKPDGSMDLLTQEFEGRKMGLVDDLDIGSDGVIYFSDASWKFGVGRYRDDLLEHGLNGSVYAYHPSSGKTERLMDSLSFANGIALSPDESFLLINETGAYRIHKLWLKGPRKGQADIFADNLPGFPDNLSCNGRDMIWVALANPRNAALDEILPDPLTRKIAYRLPEFLQPAEVKHGMVLGFDLEGNLIHNLQDPDGGFAPVTSVNEWNGKLYLGSLSDDAWAYMPLP